MAVHGVATSMDRTADVIRVVAAESCWAVVVTEAVAASVMEDAVVASTWANPVILAATPASNPRGCAYASHAIRGPRSTI
jgi:hypothetical protein